MTPELGSAGTILVIDDSPDTLSFLTDALDAAGMTVLVAIGGESALALLGEAMPDVVLMDAIMPGMDGFETCRRIKSDPQFAHLPVIFMTGLSETEHVVHGLEAGGVDYVTKPIIADELIARIRVHRNNARVTRSAKLALNSGGRALLAANASGDILWITPSAAELLQPGGGSDGQGAALPEEAKNWTNFVFKSSGVQPPLRLNLPGAGALVLTVVTALNSNELLIAVKRGERDAADLFRTRFGLTPREAEVLMWISCGKSNKDIADILGASPRTINKHLEQIYAKLGVENRTSATALALAVTKADAQE